VQSAGDAHALRSHLRDKQPADLVILDVGLPDADGIKLVSEIRDAHDVPVLVFSGSSDEKTIRACERNGAVGFVAKHDKPHALLIAVAKVLAGERCFPQYYLEWVKTACDDTVQLNQSQERVLRLLIAGHRNKDIAEQLHLSVGSVKNIVTALLQSFQVDSRQRLILAALAAGYKPDPRTATSNTLN
jgi:DNA-binding NarL/FixJ family response regulator